MNKYIKYLIYVLKHKKYVFDAGMLLNVPIWNLIWHDWDKFLPSMIHSYANYFYDKKEKFHIPGENDSFDLNWLNHIHRNKHHWQYWLLKNDSGDVRVLEMPDNDIREMVSDWEGAGMAQGNKELESWYDEHKYQIILGKETRRKVEYYIKVMNLFKDRI